MSEKYLIAIIGHSCTGKSSVLKAINKQSESSYYLVADKVKKYISNYANDNPVHLGLKDKLVKSTFDIVLNENFSVLFELSFSELRSFDHYYHSALQKGFRVIIYEFVAPKNILLGRFNKRLQEGTAKGSRFVTTTEEAYWNNYDANSVLLNEFKSHFPICESIDTSMFSIDDLATKIKP